jgi:hypothetical protein
MVISLLAIAPTADGFDQLTVVEALCLQALKSCRVLLAIATSSVRLLIDMRELLDATILRSVQGGHEFQTEIRPSQQLWITGQRTKRRDAPSLRRFDRRRRDVPL